MATCSLGAWPHWPPCLPSQPGDVAAGQQVWGRLTGGACQNLGQPFPSTEHHQSQGSLGSSPLQSEPLVLESVDVLHSHVHTLPSVERVGLQPQGPDTRHRALPNGWPRRSPQAHVGLCSVPGSTQGHVPAGGSPICVSGHSCVSGASRHCDSSCPVAPGEPGCRAARPQSHGS